MRKWAYAAATGVAVVVAMTGCTAGSGGPTSSSTSAAPSAGSGGSSSEPGSSASATTPPATSPATPPATSTPKPTSTPIADPDPHRDHGTVPTTCKGTMSTATYAKFTAGTPLNPAGYDLKKELGLIAVPAQTNGRAIECLWRDPRADITNLDVVVAPVDPVKAYAAMKALETKADFTCVPLGEGTRCQMISKDPLYGVELGSTYYVRGSTGVYVSQANFPTNGLLNEIIAQVW